MVDKIYCMNSYLIFRFIVDDKINFSKDIIHKVVKTVNQTELVNVNNEIDINVYLENCFRIINSKYKKIGILLSGGMDSAILARYLKKDSIAYTFNFNINNFQKDEQTRAEFFANYNNLNIKYVNIDFANVQKCINSLIENKGAPIHSIEPQLYIACEQAMNDGVDCIIYGDAADYVFGGMDKLLSKDWEINDFINFSTYVNTKDVLNDYLDLRFEFEKYLKNNKFYYIDFYNNIVTSESYLSYQNVFSLFNINAIDPYENLKLAKGFDLNKIRKGYSKPEIRNLFKLLYSDVDIPEKNPMPRPVDFYFENWVGPKRSEFVNNININRFSGNQKWMIWCLEYFLNYFNF